MRQILLNTAYGAAMFGLVGSAFGSLVGSGVWLSYAPKSRWWILFVTVPFAAFLIALDIALATYVLD